MVSNAFCKSRKTAILNIQYTAVHVDELFVSTIQKGRTLAGLAGFHSDRTTSKRIALIKISVIDFTSTGDVIRIILAGILSIPVDLQGNERSIQK